MVRGMAVLRGIVKERQTNRKVPWLVISLDGQVASTDQNGAFIFRGVTVGKHRLNIRAEMYRPITKEIEITDSMQTIEITVDSNTL